MPKKLSEYNTKRGPSLPLRIFESSKPRFDKLQQRLTIENGGKPLSQAQVLEYLLDLADEITGGVIRDAN